MTMVSRTEDKAQVHSQPLPVPSGASHQYSQLIEVLTQQQQKCLCQQFAHRSLRQLGGSAEGPNPLCEKHYLSSEDFKLDIKRSRRRFKRVIQSKGIKFTLFKKFSLSLSAVGCLRLIKGLAVLV
ncbi:uncharacterized protein ACWYII_007739 [Salvelinus alpinus]